MIGSRVPAHPDPRARPHARGSPRTCYLQHARSRPEDERMTVRSQCGVGCRRRAIGIAFILLLAFGVSAQPAYEVPPVRLQASAVLPADLIKGPNHAVADEVVSDGYMYHYRIASRFGEFTAVSTALLRIRIAEINAMAAMEQIEATSEFTASFEASAKRNIQGIENLVTQPVETLQGAVSGVARLFDRANENLFGSTRSQAEGSRWQDVVGYARAKREVAHQFGVDVYSSNATLQ